MPRNSIRIAGPYRVVFSTRAWKAIGQMPSSTFEVLRQKVDALAEQRPPAQAPGATESGAERLQVNELCVTYARDHSERTLTILDIGPGVAPSP